MKRYYFSGVVHPERALLNLEVQPLQIMTAEYRLLANLRFNVFNNHITAVLDVQEENLDYFTLRNLIRAHINTFISIYGFLKGRSYDVEITKIFTADLDETQVFGIDIPVLEERNAQIDIGRATNSIFQLCAEPAGKYLRRCLDDLIMSMKYVEDTAFYCYRAIESIKQYFGEKLSISNDRKKWEAFSAAINVQESEIELIRDLANPSRHGTPIDITEDQRIAIFQTTWTIIEKFINYRMEESKSAFRFHV